MLHHEEHPEKPEDIMTAPFHTPPPPPPPTLPYPPFSGTKF